MTHANLPLYAAYFLLGLGATLLLTVARFVVLFEARRRGLTAFLRWLVPSALASFVSLAAQVIGAVGPGLVNRFTPRLGPQYVLLLFKYGLDALATALALVGVFQLWRMIRDWPVGTGAGGETPPGGLAAGRQPGGVWPPPPAGPA